MKSEGGNRKKGWEIRERDEEIVRWLGRHRLATAEQVMRRYGMHRAKAYARLGVLAEAGLVRHEPGIRSARVYLATRAGLRRTGMNLPAGTVSAASFAHDLAVVDVGIVLEQHYKDAVLTEREIRASERASEYQLREPVSRGAMWPDLVIDLPQRHAVEIELTLKSRDRLAAKLRAYDRSTYAAVTYFTSDRAIAAALREVGARTGLGDRLRIERIPDVSETRRDEPQSERTEATAPVEEESRALAAKLERANADLSARDQEINKLASIKQMLINELLSYLDAGHRQRAEIRRRWEQQLAPLRRDR